MAKENSVIDWEAYGTLLKAARLANGYSRGKKLTDAVEEKTGMRISERTIYALEDASRAPSADIFLALQQVLPELCDPEYMRPAFRKADIQGHASSRCPRRRGGSSRVEVQRGGAHPLHCAGRRHGRGAYDGMDERRVAGAYIGARRNRVLEPQPARAVAQGRHEWQHPEAGRSALRLRRGHPARAGASGRPRLPYRRAQLLF